MSIAEKKMFGKNKRGENGGEKRDPLPKKGSHLFSYSFICGAII
jgi:hypothetical protein